jgi:hypothetical protein
MNEDKFMKLTEPEQNKLIAFRESEVQLIESETKLTNAKKWKIIFERAPPETIPFIIYCTEVAVISLFALFRVLNLEGNKFYFGLGAIFCAMFFPLLVLPGKSWKDLWKWFKADVLRKEGV